MYQEEHWTRLKYNNQRADPWCDWNGGFWLDKLVNPKLMGNRNCYVCHSRRKHAKHKTALSFKSWAHHRKHPLHFFVTLPVVKALMSMIFPHTFIMTTLTVAILRRVLMLLLHLEEWKLPVNWVVVSLAVQEMTLHAQNDVGSENNSGAGSLSKPTIKVIANHHPKKYE